ncbi:BlaI/MecI/CopY family transcriptional regulator [Hirschia litorea]|uniref:BlaI/MecI/CopY family transcriptional regulator n=1 Tax=Hirschia litorea TaxID=1199156 RepID=A0ABW2IK63_9PROT
MSQQPNKSELTVLKRFWTVGEQSAREVHDSVTGETGWSYSTTRTVINRMTDKSWLTRRDVHGITVFDAAISKVEVFSSLVKDLTRKVMDIEGDLPVSMFAKSPHLSSDELDELDGLINASENTQSERGEKS